MNRLDGGTGADWRPWLPAEALQRDDVEQMLADAARQWSAKWFARRNVRPTGPIARLASFAATKGERWLTLDDDLTVVVPDASRLQLVSMMLDAPVDPGAQTDADRQVVADLSTACLDDLCRRLARMFRLPDDARWSQLDAGDMPVLIEPRGWSLGADNRALLRVAVSTSSIVALVKSGLPTPVPAQEMQPLAAGLLAQPIGLSALLGRCSLTLTELAELGEGDVLVFDTETMSSLSLSVDHATAPVGRCSVEERDDAIHLKLLEPLTR